MMEECPLWLNGIGGLLGVLDTGLILGLAQWVKDWVLSQLWLRLQCGLDLIPGLETPHVMGRPEKKKITRLKLWF